MWIGRAELIGMTVVVTGVTTESLPKTTETVFGWLWDNMHVVWLLIIVIYCIYSFPASWFGLGQGRS